MMKNSENLFKWYQQLIAESLRKEKKRFVANCVQYAKR